MKKSTSELLEILKKSPDIPTYTDRVSGNLIEQLPLHTYLLKILEEKQLKRSDVAHASGLDRGYVYDIFAGKKTPSRDKLLALCFALRLSDVQVQRLLNSTGYAQLYPRIERDSIILFALGPRQPLSLLDANELLYEMNHQPLI